MNCLLADGWQSYELLAVLLAYILHKGVVVAVFTGVLVGSPAPCVETITAFALQDSAVAFNVALIRRKKA